MFYDENDLEYEEGLAPEGPEDRPSLEDLRAAAEVVVFLEHEIGVNPKYLRVRVRQGVVFLQGSVSSNELKREIEERLPSRPGVRGVEINLSVVEFGN